ncbi:DUF885 family protein [Kribbella sp. NPDC050124]|uniref:DUF885 family protein n=1 Tax=Kribbella sp. NPDC050124 TaxID=3364114 RepID=UPI0037BCE497
MTDRVGKDGEPLTRSWSPSTCSSRCRTGTWNPSLGREFMGQHCALEPSVLDFEVKRYLGVHGQALSYKVVSGSGWRPAINVRRVQGDAFDLAEFDHAALDLGSLGLDPLAPVNARASRFAVQSFAYSLPSATVAATDQMRARH